MGKSRASDVELRDCNYGLSLQDRLFPYKLNPLVRDAAEDILASLNPYLNEWETRFLHSILEWTDERSYSLAQRMHVEYARRNAMRKKLSAERQAKRDAPPQRQE